MKRACYEQAFPAGRALERECSENLYAAVFCRTAEGGGCIMDADAVHYTIQIDKRVKSVLSEVHGFYRRVLVGCSYTADISIDLGNP